MVGGVVAPGTVVAPGSTAVDDRTVKLKRSVAPASPVGWLTCQATLHSPTGIGSVTSTVNVRRSSLSTGRLIAENGSLLHATCTELASPSSLSNVSTISDGGSSSSAPSAGMLSTSDACWAPAEPATISAAPSAARAATTKRSVRPGTPVRAGTTGTR